VRLLEEAFLHGDVINIELKRLELESEKMSRDDMINRFNKRYRALSKKKAFTCRCCDEPVNMNLTKEEGRPFYFKHYDWEITLDRITKEKPYCNDAVTGRAHSQKKPRKNESPVIVQPNQVKWGAKLDLHGNHTIDIKEEKDIIEEILKEEDEKHIRIRNTGIWLKFEGNSENRILNHLTYFERRKKEHRKSTFFPKPPSGIKDGQLLFMTMVSTDKDDKGTPIIVGYAITSGFNEKNIVDDNTPFNLNDRRGRYPYFFELTSGRFLKAPIKEGITLRELARELQTDLYPNPKSNFNEIIYTHRQNSHLQVTKRAHDYIMQRLESLFNEFGYDEL
jgi:hypothetical protein